MLGLGGGVLGAGAAGAQTLDRSTAPVGPDLRVGDLRGQFDSVFGNVSPPGTQPYTINYGLGVSESYDDGVPVRTRYGADLITRISPNLSIAADSSAVQGNLFYAPSLNVYTFHGNQTNVTQNLNGSATATLLPDLFFVDIRAFAADQPAIGGQNVSSLSNSAGDVQTTSYSITPRLQHRFGGTGTLVISDMLSRTETATSNTGTNSNTAPNAFNPYGSQAVNGSSITNAQHVNFTSGEDYGRLQSSFDLLNSMTTSSGGIPNSKRLVYGYNGAYALDRVFTVTAGVGHENISYGGQIAAIDDVTWTGGFRLTPDEDTLLSVSYGHHDGGNAAMLTGNLAPTARTRLFAQYGQTIGTQLEQTANNINTSRSSITGVSYDPVTGAPVQVNNNYAGLTSQPVYRTTTASISGVLTYDRDIFNVTFAQNDSQLLSSATTMVANGFTASSTTGYQASIAWSHTLSPDLSSNTSLQYSATTSPFKAVGAATNANQTTLTFNATLNYTISPTLTAMLQYTRVNTSGISFGQAPRRDIAIISLQKIF